MTSFQSSGSSGDRLCLGEHGPDFGELSVELEKLLLTVRDVVL